MSIKNIKSAVSGFYHAKIKPGIIGAYDYNEKMSNLDDTVGSNIWKLSPLVAALGIGNFIGSFPFMFGRGYSKAHTLGGLVADIIGYEKNISAESVFKELNDPGKYGKTIEAARQGLISSQHKVFDEATEDEVLAIEPYFGGRRLDGKDPAENVLSLLTIEDFVNAKRYARNASMAFGLGAASAIGFIMGAMFFIGSIHVANSVGVDNAVVDSFSQSALAATSAGSGFLSKAGEFMMGFMAFASPFALAPLIGKASMGIFERVHLGRYIDILCTSLYMNAPTKDYKLDYWHALPDLGTYLTRQMRRVSEGRRSKKMKLPTLKIGTSTGILRNTGVQGALEEGTPLQVSVLDMFMNTVVLGGTGAGKSSSILLPIVRELFIHRYNNTIGKFGMYVTDAKGVLWVDVKQIANEEGLTDDDVIVIGVNPGQYGVHLTKGVPPQMLAALISSIMKTVEGNSGSGGGGSAFYEGMFAIVFTHMAVLLDAYDRSPAGSRFTATEHRSIYCIERLNEMLTVETAMEAMMKELLTEVELAKTGANFYSKAAKEAVTYFNTQWQDMETDTKANLRATVTKNLGGLMSHPVIRTMFFEGRDNIILRDKVTGKPLLDENGNTRYLEQFDSNGNPMRFIDVDGALNGKLVCVSISAEQGGLGASFALSALSSRYRMIATDREIEYKLYNDSIPELKKKAAAQAKAKANNQSVNSSIDFEEEDVFAELMPVNENFEPSPRIRTFEEMAEIMENSPSNDEIIIDLSYIKPLNAQDTPSFYLGDEMQELIFKGGKNFPVGDEAFWAKSRSKGIVGIIAFQALSSIRQFIGADSSATMLANFRNKFLLHTEDIEAVNIFKELAGKTTRYRSPIGSGAYETQASLEMHRNNDMQTLGLLKKGGAYPNLYLGTGISHIDIKNNIGIDDENIALKTPRQRKFLTAPMFEEMEEYGLRSDPAYYDKGMELNPEYFVKTMAMKIGASIEPEGLSEMLAEQEAKEKESSAGFKEEIIDMRKLLQSRGRAYAYLQSYSGTLIDLYEVKQDHELRAERAEIHKQIKAKQAAVTAA